jgi:hypothetical protein
VFEVLDNAVTEVCELDVSSMSDAGLHVSVVELSALMDRLSALQTRVVGEWDAREVWSSDGSRSAGHRLSRETGMSLTSAHKVVRRARRLRSMPVVRDAFCSGSLSRDRVDLLVRANQPGVSSVFSRDESLLVNQIGSLSFDQAARAVGYWSQCANNELAEESGDHLVEVRSASLSRTLSGTRVLDAVFDPVGGEIFSNVLSSIEDELFREDWQEATTRCGDSITVLDLARTAGQRRLDALVEMAKRASSVPSRARVPRPLVTVLVDYETFAGRICELASGIVLAPGQVVPLLSEADIERIVFDGPSRVLDVGEKRAFTGALRRAIEVRDRFCQDDSGCDVPAQRCDIDHIVPWSRGGRTTQDNGKCLCPKHNRRKGCGP